MKKKLYLHYYLQVILIFGISGTLRTIDFCNITTQDVEDTGIQFIVAIKDRKNCYPRHFIIGKEFYNYLKKHILLHPNDIDTNRFFIYYRKGHCTRQVIGKNKFSKVPKTMAFRLQLEDPDKYTGHCFCRTSATLFAGSGANISAIKQLGGWKSSSVAEGYVEHSLANRKKIFYQIITLDQPTSPSSCHSYRTMPPAKIPNSTPSCSYVIAESQESESTLDLASFSHCNKNTNLSPHTEPILEIYD